MAALPVCCQSGSVQRTLLCALQAALGRKSGGIRYGPRPLDLDIVFYGDQRIAHERLQVPHLRWQERPFVQVSWPAGMKWKAAEGSTRSQ